MPPKIVVVGSYNTDLVVYVPVLPQIGETISGYKFDTGPGGKGSNQAVAAARLGAEVTFVGRIGNDNFGQVGRNLWQQEGINSQYVVQDQDNATGVASIFVEDSGENMIATAAGANKALSPTDIEAASETIGQADLLLAQLEIPLSTVEHALKIAKANGVTTIVNPAPARELPEAFLELVDYLTPNEQEVETLTGMHSASLENEAETLLTNNQQTIIVTMGAWGALCVSKTGHNHITAYEVEAMDAVGAGDAFNGGLAVALAEGQDLQKAILFASATAAISVTRAGAASSMPGRADVEALIQQQPRTVQ